MSQVRNYITLDSVINDYIDESEQSVHKYAKLYNIAVRGMEKLGLDFFYKIRTVKVAIDTTNYTAQLPNDYISYTKIDSTDAIRTHKYDPMSILSGDFRTDPQIPSANEYSVDTDKIKINLNLDNSTLGSILNKYEPGNTQTGENTLPASNTDCDETKWLDRDSVRSVCVGCDPDSIDPVN